MSGQEGVSAQQGMIASMMARNLEGNGGVGAGGLHMQSIFRLGFPVGGDGQEMGMLRSMQDTGQGLKLETTAIIKDFNAFGLAGFFQTSGLSMEGLQDMFGMGDGGGEPVVSDGPDSAPDTPYVPQGHGFSDSQSGESGGADSSSNVFTNVPNGNLGEFQDVPAFYIGNLTPIVTPSAGRQNEIGIG